MGAGPASADPYCQKGPLDSLHFHVLARVQLGPLRSCIRGITCYRGIVFRQVPSRYSKRYVSTCLLHLRYSHSALSLHF
jgi:hypothetical protein